MHGSQTSVADLHVPYLTFHPHASSELHVVIGKLRYWIKSARYRDLCSVRPWPAS